MSKSTVRNRILATGLFMLCGITHVFSQVVIKETVNIESDNSSRTIEPPDVFTSAEGLAQAGEFYYPVLRDIGFGRYIVLKSGELKFFVSEATTYGISNLYNSPFIYSVKGTTTNISSTSSLLDFMQTPIKVQDRASVCSEPRAYFQDTLSYTTGVVQDTYTLKSQPTTTHENSTELLALGLFARVPEAQWAFTFVDFGIDSLLTNGQLSKALLSIESAQNDPDLPLPSGTTTEYPFLLMKTPWAWNAQTLTYNNQPDLGPGAGISVSSDDLIPNTSYLYQKEITPIVNEWFSGISPDYGLMIESEGRYTFASDENNQAGSKPQLKLTLNAPVSNADNILTIGNVQAGDTLEIDFQDLGKDLFGNFETNDAGIEAEDQLIFLKEMIV